MFNRFFEMSLIEPFFYNKHGRIINRMRSAGYDTDSGGMCYGIAHMGVQALLVGEISSLSYRLAVIDSYSPHALIDKVADEKQKQVYLVEIVKADVLNQIESKDAGLDPAVKVKISEQVTAHLSPEEQEFLQIPAFFDGVQLLARPYLYPELFEEKLLSWQNAEKVFPLIQSKKMAKFGNITAVSIHSGAYTSDELVTYFSMIRESLKKEPVFQLPFAMTINDAKHVITIGYNFKFNNWIFIDANQLPIKYFATSEELSTYLKAAFTCKEMSTFTSTFYTTKPHNETLKNKLNTLKDTQEWKTMHTVTAKKSSFKDPLGATWLTCAAMMGDLDNVDQLVKAGADLNTSHALDVAVMNNHIDVVKYLLQNIKNSILIDKKDKNHPLALSAIVNNTNMINLLLQFKDNPLQSLEDEAMALIIACMLGEIDIAKQLLECKVDPNKIPLTKETPLITASSTENFALVKLLLQYHADINLANNEGVTPLITACLKKRVDIVQHLLKEGANPNAFDKQGLTPLIAVGIKGSAEILEELLKHNVFINQTFQADSSVLIKHAIKHKKQSSAEKLLRKNNKLGIPQYIPGMTALHMAAYYGHAELVKILIAEGANIHLTSSNGITALELAEAMGHRDIVSVLELQSYKSLLPYCDPYRGDAINTLLQRVKESKSIENTEKEITIFKKMDVLAQQLLNIATGYKPNNPQRIKSLNELQSAVAETYKDYFQHPEDENIIKNLKIKADHIALLAKIDHEKTSRLYSIYGKRSELESKINTIILSKPLQNPL